eukprot:CAMPEP_0119308764 /NCGR_PEP_ID=MMETSP1333-20130426/12752_1 /TAXON_ID=418940 /ORGANISM="Scyphosphaera apsteinii, Strain RCC1455" /LENGTH=227 /DNA_ID=CAMNT_0007312609 /DNA_START=18 /DNA_END=701 /DNA_ORIENTATION=+
MLAMQMLDAHTVLPSASLIAAASNSVGLAYGSVNAPPYLLPVAAAATGLLPLLLLAATTTNMERPPPVDPVIVSAERYPSKTRRTRRERLLARLAFAIGATEGKGLGLFAKKSLPAGEYLFDYEGEKLDYAAYHARYPDGVSDYAVGIRGRDGGMMFVDAAHPSSGLGRFINHSSRHANVARRTLHDSDEGPRVLMYTKQAIAPGEELQWDYGNGYWAAHSGLIDDQ